MLLIPCVVYHFSVVQVDIISNFKNRDVVFQGDKWWRIIYITYIWGCSSIAKDPNVEGKNKTNLFDTIYTQMYLDFFF